MAPDTKTKLKILLLSKTKTAPVAIFVLLRMKVSVKVHFSVFYNKKFKKSILTKGMRLCYHGGMTVGNTAKKGGAHKGLVALVFALVGIAVVLVVVIVVMVSTSKPQSGVGYVIDETNDGMDLSREIVNRFYSEPNYDISDMEKDFRDAIRNKCDSPYCRVYVAINYGNQVWEFRRSLSVAEQAFAMVNSDLSKVTDSVKIDYYTALKELYNAAGSLDRVQYYEELISELYGDNNGALNNERDEDGDSGAEQ